MLFRVQGSGFGVRGGLVSRLIIQPLGFLHGLYAFLMYLLSPSKSIDPPSRALEVEPEDLKEGVSKDASEAHVYTEEGEK